MSNRKKAAASGETVAGPWALPVGWHWKRLGDVAEVNPRTQLPETGTVAFVPMASVEEETFRIDVSQRRTVAEASSNYTRFKSADVLFAKITPCMENGKVAVVPETPERILAGSTEFHVLRSTELYPKYLAYWISRRAFRDDARRHMTGTAGQMRVPADYLRRAPMPVPEKRVQEKIVARIEELFGEIDDGETALARARADLEVYRRALLKAAVTGELTSDWRAANPPKETGPALLARILATRRARWQADPRKKGKRYEEPRPADTSWLPALPPSWTWASLAQLSWASSYGTSGKCSHDGVGTPVLRIPNIKSGSVNLRDLKRSLSPLELRPGEQLQPADLLIVRTNGSDDLIGRAGLVLKPFDEPTFFASYLIRFRLAVTDNLLRWLSLLCEGPIFRASVLRSIGTSAGQYNLSLSKLERFPMPLPPPCELNHIMAACSKALGTGMEAAETLSDMESAKTSLRQSILSAAFRGDLL